MQSDRLYTSEDVTKGLVLAIMADYGHQYPSYNTMMAELQGYDLVELTMLLTNIMTLYQYMVWGDLYDATGGLSDSQRQWMREFCLRWRVVLNKSINDCQVVYT